MSILSQLFKKVSSPVINQEETIQEIHNKVDWFSLYTKDILGEEINKKIKEKQVLIESYNNQITRREKVGFALTPQQILEKQNLEKVSFDLQKEIDILQQEKSERTIVNEMRLKYPQRKFIYMKDLQEVCKKYQLALGWTIDYIGELPEKNLIEIEKYIKPEEALDIVEEVIEKDWDNENHRVVVKTKLVATKPLIQEFTVAGAESFVNSRFNREFNPQLWLEVSRKLSEYNNTFKFLGRKPPEGFFKFNENQIINTFMIACPAQDLTKTINDVKVSYIKDPIVLYPIKHPLCLEIIAKWGLEASDEKLLNPINN